MGVASSRVSSSCESATASHAEFGEVSTREPSSNVAPRDQLPSPRCLLDAAPHPPLYPVAELHGKCECRAWIRGGFVVG